MQYSVPGYERKNLAESDAEQEGKLGGGGGEDEEVHTLLCRHRFHSECLHLWAHKCRAKAIEATCPMCRVALTI
eukprot:25107-Eustigmatos_ZCMA.PRE.1